jgi:hypothetical protein
MTPRPEHDSNFLLSFQAWNQVLNKTIHVTRAYARETMPKTENEPYPTERAWTLLLPIFTWFGLTHLSAQNSANLSPC